MLSQACKICSTNAQFVCTKRGRFFSRDFSLFACPKCNFFFVADPSRDYDQIYDTDYFAGRGADPMVDYEFEFEHPQSTVRAYEWSGILKLVSNLTSDVKALKWLDYGCGTGGLVRHLISRGFDAVGTDTGGFCDRIVAAGIPFISAEDLNSHAGSFDIISLIEVLEHVEQPLDLLRFTYRLLKPGGLLFFTTGNSAPHRSRICQWSYFTPEIHISLFDPLSAGTALTLAGFTSCCHTPSDWNDIIKFKILKNLGVKYRSTIFDFLPWPMIARLVDRRFEVSAMPFGRKPISA